MTESTITNPRTGQTMTFVRTGADTKGELLRIECFHEPSSAREPIHTHPRQESRFEIIEGRLGFLVDGVQRFAVPGDVVTIAARVPHCFWNDGDKTARYIQEFRPALDSERFFRTLFDLAAAGRLDDRGMPSTLALPVLVRSMGNAIRPMRPPWFLLKCMAWVLAPIARLRGA